MSVPTIQFVMRPLWQRILIAVWPPYERAKRQEDQQVFDEVMREWQSATQNSSCSSQGEK